MDNNKEIIKEKIFIDSHCHIFNMNNVSLTLQFERTMKFITKLTPAIFLVPITGIGITIFFYIFKMKFYKFLERATDILELEISDILIHLKNELGKITEFNGHKKILIPLILDFERAKPKEKLVNQVENTLNGIKIFKKENPEAPINIYPFIGIDPARLSPSELKKFLDKYLKGRKKTPKDGDFIGVKLYPPLGCEVYPYNASNRVLYDYCLENDIPITCHTVKNGFVSAKNIRFPEISANRRTSPANWEKILKSGYENLRLNLAHFANLKFFWRKKIIYLIKNYENVYTDLSCFFGDKHKIKKLIRLIKNDRKGKLGSGKYRIEDKILFGTDFSMMLFKSESYSQYTKQIMDMVNEYDNTLFDKMSRQNPLKFLNIKPPKSKAFLK